MITRVVLSFIPFLFAFAPSFTLYSQIPDTIYYKASGVLSSVNDFDYYAVLLPADSLTYHVREYHKGDSLKSTYSCRAQSQIGLSSANFDSLLNARLVVLNGTRLIFTNDTIVVGETRYNMGEVVYGPVAYSEGDTLYAFELIDEMPRFTGGGLSGFQQHIASHLRYPAEAVAKGVSGVVYVQFLVNKLGEVCRVRVYKGVDPALDRAAVDVVKSSPRWIPGKRNGNPISVRFTMPIVFRL
ncbi:MAG: energy transducer TonB [Bacteroidales bacterium]|nr:energy transducer TonB [Bacteroidales bacterium]